MIFLLTLPSRKSGVVYDVTAASRVVRMADEAVELDTASALIIEGLYSGHFSIRGEWCDANMWRRQREGIGQESEGARDEQNAVRKNKQKNE